MDKRDYQRFWETINYYRFSSLTKKLSDYLKLSLEEKNKLITLHSLNQPNVEIICYIFMPNHYHLLLQQNNEGGISKFLKNISDSYTRYFNTKYERIGPLFQGQFKAVFVEGDEQLLHLSRYIHLNPFTSYVLKDIKKLVQYQWSSLKEYLSSYKIICNKSIIMDQFPNIQAYKEFVLNQAEYQQKLENIKHLVLE